jgi:multisubunit Na+/H+ antiporter MnhG subunit
VTQLRASPDSESAGAVGMVLGLVGYFLGMRRLGAATIVVCMLALFFMAGASTGLIPVVTPPGHGYD